MNFPDEAPKLPKLPFIAGDLALLATAAVIALRGDSPLTTGAILAITICVALGAALLVIPFLADYTRLQDAELTERQNQIAALARTTAESAEQLGIATAGLGGIAETSKLNLASLEQLPARLQEHIDALGRQLSAVAASSAQTAAKDDARLDAALEKLNRALAKLETAAQARTGALAASENALAASVARATAQIEALTASARLAASREADAPAPAPSEKTPVVPPVVPVTPAVVEPGEPVAVVPAGALPSPASPVETPVDETPAVPAPEEPSARRQPETPVFAPTEPDADEVPVAEPPAPRQPRTRKARQAAEDHPDLGLTPDADEPAGTAVTSDGFTRLIATAYIGIGNKLFIRGEGPGLSWEKGVPLQFVSIGKWRWETPDATAPVTVRLYKNDQVECLGLGTLTLQPGHQHEVNAGF